MHQSTFDLGKDVYILFLSPFHIASSIKLAWMMTLEAVIEGEYEWFSSHLMQLRHLLIVQLEAALLRISQR